METTYTLRGLSRQLSLDVRYLQRALLDTAPDEIHGTRRRWLLATAKAAIAAHGHNQTGPGGYNGSNGNRVDGLVELERSAIDLQGMIDRLKGEKNLKARRAMAKEIGPALIRFQQTLNTSAAVLPPSLRELTQATRAEILGEALAEVAALLALDLDRCA